MVCCSWNKPEVGVKHVEDMLLFREHNTQAMKERFKGVVLTVWSGADQFIDGLESYLENTQGLSEEEMSQPWVTFVKMFDKIETLSMD